MERGGDRRGRKRREESVPIVPVLRNDHCTIYLISLSPYIIYIIVLFFLFYPKKSNLT